jgi:hypothetical protein
MRVTISRSKGGPTSIPDDGIVTPQRRGYAPEPKQKPEPKSAKKPSEPVLEFTSGGYILVGAKGSSKTQVSLQIAETLLSQSQIRPRVVFIGKGSVADAAYLTQKAKLLGVETLILSAADLTHQTAFNMARDIIIVSSDIAIDITHDRFETGKVLSVLTTGLSHRAQRLCLNTWPECRDVIISYSSSVVANDEDVIECQKAGVAVICLSDKDRVLNGLTRSDRIYAQAQATAQAQQKAERLVTERDRHDHDTGSMRTRVDRTLQSTQTDALPTMLRKRWGGETLDFVQNAPPRVVPMLNINRNAPQTSPYNREGAKL